MWLSWWPHGKLMLDTYALAIIEANGLLLLQCSDSRYIVVHFGEQHDGVAMVCCAAGGSLHGHGALTRHRTLQRLRVAVGDVIDFLCGTYVARAVDESDFALAMRKALIARCVLDPLCEPCQMQRLCAAETTTSCSR